ncbi:HlyIII-domain-containing protein [Rickenella mellea]|uniref:HlyIII-domain-containing protein n=1 Tax=Rickenella mellea TaxID=50990 RepID=A0A4Y7QFE0_9AGAM|nr:HlyIII-domain-containing protein [Rickenella mellea]
MSTTSTSNNLNILRIRRRLSTPHPRPTPPPIVTCSPLPSSLSALDLSSASPTPLLASLHLLVLSHLAELEKCLSVDPALSDALRIKGEDTVEEALTWAHDGLEILRNIRDDVCSHLPEVHFDAASVEALLRSHIHDLPALDDVLARLPDLPDVRAHLPEFDLADMRSRLQDVRTRFSEIELDHPMKYLPKLSSHLQSLHAHLSPETYSSYHLPSLPTTRTIVEVLDNLLTSNLFPGTLRPPQTWRESKLEKVARDIAQAVTRSFNGAKLVTYVDLPEDWRNNPFVFRGYRFIPLNRWHLIILSLFALHNETLNIHTHMIPFFLPFFNYSLWASDLAERIFMSFAQLCLFSSALWHTMSGCAHLEGMEFCARVDYIGIGWLISASVGTVVYYSFECHQGAIVFYLSLCFLSGILGSVFPFMKWFNAREHRGKRVVFFLGLAFTGIAPLAHLSWLYSTSTVLSYIRPVLPSLLSYVIGLGFYMSHIPERFLSGNDLWSRLTDGWLGGGSHAIWHGFIVLAIYQHKWAMEELRGGVLERC